MLFHRCFGIRISSPFHLETLNIPIQNIKCPESPKNANIIMLPSVSLFRLLRGRYKTTQQSEKVTRVDIWRDQWDRRSRKFFVSCVNFLENNAKCFIISTQNRVYCEQLLCKMCDYCSSLHILCKFVFFFTQNV